MLDSPPSPISRRTLTITPTNARSRERLNSYENDRSTTKTQRTVVEAGPLPKSIPSKQGHELLARAMVLWDWDGTILNCLAKGPSVKRGDKIDICGVVDTSWYQVHHQGSCKYIPREYLGGVEVYDKRFQSHFHVRGATHTPPPPTPTQGCFAPFCLSTPKSTLPSSEKPRPPVPPPPDEKGLGIQVDQTPQTQVVDRKRSRMKRMFRSLLAALK